MGGPFSCTERWQMHNNHTVVCIIKDIRCSPAMICYVTYFLLRCPRPEDIVWDANEHRPRKRNDTKLLWSPQIGAFCLCHFHSASSYDPPSCRDHSGYYGEELGRGVLPVLQCILLLPHCATIHWEHPSWLPLITLYKSHKIEDKALPLKFCADDASL